VGGVALRELADLGMTVEEYDALKKERELEARELRRQAKRRNVTEAQLK
jgi:hypothetical protein